MKNKALIKRLSFIIILLGLFISLTISFFVVDTVEAQVKADTEVTKETLEVIPFFWTVGIIGGIIGLTLVYVSWRKYKAEKKERCKKSNH